MIDWTVAAANGLGVADRTLDIALRPRHGVAKAQPTRQRRDDGRGERAAGPVGGWGLQAWSAKLGHDAAIIEQVDRLRSIEVTAGDDDRRGTLVPDLRGGPSRVIQRRDRHPCQRLRFHAVRGHEARSRNQSGPDEIDGVVIEGMGPPRPEGGGEGVNIHLMQRRLEEFARGIAEGEDWPEAESGAATEKPEG